MATNRRRIRFSLLSILVVVSICALLANSFRRPTTVELIEQIYSEVGVDPVFDERGLAVVAPVTSKFEAPLPTELRHYIEHLLPTESIRGGPVWFHSADDINFLAENSVPDATVTPYGFFCFAQEGDGSAFAYCIHDSHIYHLGFVNEGDYGATMSWKDIAKNAWESWPDLRSFLEEELNYIRSVD